MLDHLELEAYRAQWQRQRGVRAAAYWRSSGPVWAGSRELTVVFERRALASFRPAVTANAGEVTLPFEALEQALQLAAGGEVLQAAQHLSYPQWGLSAGWTQGLTVLYDPARVLERWQRLKIPAEQWQRYAQQLLSAGQRQLLQGRAVRGVAAPLQGLLLARAVALRQVYPALAAQQGCWALGEDDVRLPHYWRTDFSLSAPRALSLLESLYGFGAQAQARAALAAMRGLDMLPQERLARLAIQHGYYDGATRLIRDSAATVHATDLGRWLQLLPARRERLGVLLGLERSPLGASALEVGAELLEAAQNNSN